MDLYKVFATGFTESTKIVSILYKRQTLIAIFINLRAYPLFRWDCFTDKMGRYA